MLSRYISDTRELLSDTNALFWSDSRLTRFVNLARAQVAVLSGCIRILIPGTAPLGSSALPGELIPGAALPGSGNTTFQTIVGVERYPYAYANPYARAQNSNVKGVGDVITVAVNWGGASGAMGNRPALIWMPWEDFQAYARAWAVDVTSYPYCWSTYGDGERGEVWLFPTPSEQLEMQWDIFAVPNDLATDEDFDALPSPFSTYVPFYAAHLAYLGSQRYGMADIMLQLFERNSGLSRVAADRGKTPNYYNR